MVLVRHGPAAPRDPQRWPDDELRPLTREGRSLARAAARGLQRAGVQRPWIASSPLARARATAEIVAGVLDADGSIETWPELRPEGTGAAVLRRLASRRAREGPRLLVGHEPNLGLLAGLLLSGEEVRPFRLAKSGAARLSLPRRIAPAAASLDWLLTRKQLVRLGE